MSSGDDDDNNRVTRTIEEIAPDDNATTGESQVIVDVGNPMLCERCGYGKMIRLLGCHSRCENCGSERTCSDI
jgi:predicted Zn-ribbon and HTH transcriptional regulator